VPARGGYLKTLHGTAVGLIFETDKTVIVALPGPPRELQPMVVNELLPYLRGRFGVRPRGASLTLRFVGVGQSQITQTIKESVPVPADMTITSLFEGGRVDFTFSTPANTPAAEATLARLKEQIRDKLGEYLYADDGSSLEDAVIRKLQAAGGTLVLAEVCTGGQLDASLNSAAGAPKVMAGCFAAPTEEALARLIGTEADHWCASSPAAERAKGLAISAARRTQSAWSLAAGQSQAEADGSQWAWAALRSPDGRLATQRLAVRATDDAARAQLVTQLLDFLRRQLAKPKP
ncbi:MAG: CinA family protein, partial [Verrucomicrobiae bacterium]|nr:CinA family protein [Verrucomicrobiae bacterium]